MQLPQLESARVLIVGDVMLDRYWHGPTSRVSPEAPVPVVKVDQQEDRPGGAANVALNVSALGCSAQLFALTGDDSAADSLQAPLQAAGVECHFERITSHPTITKLRVVSRQQQLLRMDFEEPFEPGDSKKLNHSVQAALEKAGALVLSDYAKGSLSEPQALIKAARAAGIPVLVDPKGSDFGKYKGASLLTPNLSEFEQVVGECDTEDELSSRALALISEYELEALLVTRGEKGMTLIRPGHPEFHLPAQAREVFDVTGAGDTVISVLASCLAAGAELPDAVALANLAAGIVVGKLGTAVISRPELEQAAGSIERDGKGVMTAEQLRLAVEEAKQRGEKVVFTNGCFDIIHAGHVGYLEQARRLGDRLIVAINSDESVTRLKGPGRPVNPVERRMAVLAGLQAVDWVTFFVEDTPEALLEQVRPDILVKGGDYDKEGVVGWQIVESYGGEVKTLNFFDDCSTTAIVEKIKQQHQE